MQARAIASLETPLDTKERWGERIGGATGLRGMQWAVARSRGAHRPDGDLDVLQDGLFLRRLLGHCVAQAQRPGALLLQA